MRSGVQSGRHQTGHHRRRCRPHTARVWDAGTGKQLPTLPTHTGWVWSVVFRPDGTRLATAADTAQVWDARTGERLLTLTGHTRGVSAVAFSPDGTRLATAANDHIDSTALVWDARTGERLLTL